MKPNTIMKQTPDIETKDSTKVADGGGSNSSGLLAFGVVMIEGSERKSAVIFASCEDQLRNHIKGSGEKGFISSVSRQPQYDMFRVTHQPLTPYNPTTAFRG